MPRAASDCDLNPHGIRILCGSLEQLLTLGIKQYAQIVATESKRRAVSRATSARSAATARRIRHAALGTALRAPYHPLGARPQRGTCRRLERTARQLEELPTRSSPESFFGQTIRLKRILTTAKGDRWRLRGLLEMLADGRRLLPGLNLDQRESIAQLIEEADYLYETVDNIRESVLSLIELHIDIAAHDTNRFIRLLAIVTTLALIPAVVGGLLGMNLSEAPWPVTLGQVAFGTLVLTIGVLYTFMAKGWLR